MKKLIYVLIAMILLCGCSSEPQDQDETKNPENTISKEEFLLNYAKNHFVGGLYELKEENLGYMYETPLRTIILETNSASLFDGCDEEKTNVRYFLYKNSDDKIVSSITINLSCSEQTESHQYSSLDNFTEKLY